MTNSLNIRLVIPYMKVYHHTQCRFMKSNMSTATSSVLCQGVGLGLALGLKIGMCLGPHRHTHFFRLGLNPYVGNFRQGIAHSQHPEPLLKSVQLCLGPSFSENLSETGHFSQGSRVNAMPAEVSAEPACDNSIDKTLPLDVGGITNGDPILERKLKILILELDVLRQSGCKVPTPSLIKKSAWKELLDTNTRSARMKLFTYLWSIEMKKNSKKVKKDTRPRGPRGRDEMDVGQGPLEINDRPTDNEHIQYGLHNNSMFMRIYDTTINQHYNNKLVQAIQFGQKIVIDCDYDQNMTPREAKNLAKQITMAFSDNRLHKDPFNLYLCNANRNDKTLNQLEMLIRTIYEDDFPLNVTNKSYLELFPKEDIVYLTPHCREELTSYNHDSIYVIGGIVDKTNQAPLSLGKAKREGLKMAKLPLDRYLTWASGSGKSLTINQMVQIMLEMKTTGDWAKALEYVPRRKLVSDSELRNEHQFSRANKKTYRY